MRDLAPALRVRRGALVRHRQRVVVLVEELEVLLTRERAERAGVQPGPPLASAVDVEALAVSGDLAGERDGGRQAREQHGRRNGTGDATNQRNQPPSVEV